MRRWDFTQLGTEHALHSNWSEIALRESRVGRHVRNICNNIDEYLLRSVKDAVPEDVTEDFIELYEIRRSYKRLDDVIAKEATEWNKEDRVDRVRALITPFAELHGLGIGHRDIDPHNLWYAGEQKSIVVSGFGAAFFPERGTLSDFRKLLQSSNIELPEDALASGDEVADPFKLDVFMLAVVAYKICFDGKSLRKSDGVPEWVLPEKDIFDGSLNKWFEKSLAWDPDDRFENADDMLSEFNIATKGTLELHDDSQQVFDDLMLGGFVRENLNPFVMFQEFPLAEGEQMPHMGSKIRYLSEKDGKKLLVKIWPNVHIKRDEPGVNRRISFFKEKVELIKRGLFTTPDVYDVGIMGGGGLFLATKYIDGVVWNLYIDNHDISDDAKKNMALMLVESIKDLHDENLAHGDLHPENILVSSKLESDGNDIEISIIDLLDYGTESNPCNTQYGPSNPASTDAFGRDRFAVYKIVEELFGDQAKQVVVDEIQRAKDCKGGVPISLEPLIEAIEQEDPLEEKIENEVGDLTSELNILWCGKGFPEEKKSLDAIDGGYHFNCKWGKSNAADPNRCPLLQCYITSEDTSLQINVDIEERRVVSIYLRDNIPLSDLVSAGLREQIRIKQKISIQYGSSPELKSDILELIMGLDPVIDIIADRFSTEADEFIIGDLSDEDETSIVSPEALWKALSETERDLCDSIVIESDEYKVSATGNYIYPYTTEGGADLNLDSEDPITLQIKGSDRGPIGEVIESESNLSTISIKFNFDSLRRSIRSGTKLILESARNKSSRDIRDRALSRVLNGKSIIKGLPKYFDKNNVPDISVYEGVPDESQFRSIYDSPGNITNEKQFDAFCKLINTGPVGVLQGPPGTGKTTFVSKFIHYLYEHCDVKNILLVGQSHTSVDNVAIKAIELCASKGMSVESVRIGREQVIDEGMLSSHAGALQRQIRHKFHREYDIRIGALSKRMSMPYSLVEALTRLHRTINPLLSSRSHYVKMLAGKEMLANSSPLYLDECSQLKESIGVVSKKIQSVVFSLFKGDFSIDLENDSNPLGSLFDFVCTAHEYNNPSEVAKLRKILDLSQEWMDVLRGGEAGYERFMIKTKQLVCGTLVGVGRTHLELQESTFDWVIVDEAGRAQAAELMVALQCGKRILLVGDHKQLPPFYQKSHRLLAARKLEVPESVFHESDFERAFKTTDGVTLDTQYRMVKPIGDLVSECFYAKDTVNLQTGRGPSPSWYSQLNNPWNKSVAWIDSNLSATDNGEKSLGKGKYINRNEVSILIKLLRELSGSETIENLKATITNEQPYPIGIITMYRAQKEEIETELSRTEWLGALRHLIKIDTVDSYQGQENKIIILSLVRDNAGSIQGFLGDAPRINVAISRAQERLMILGACRMWHRENNDSALSSVFEFINEKCQLGDENYQIVAGKDYLGGNN